MEEIVLPVAKRPTIPFIWQGYKKESKHIGRTVTDNSPEASIPQIKKRTFL